MALECRDVMTADPDTVAPDTSLAVVAEMIMEAPYSGLPIARDGTPVGVVEVGDLLPRPGQVPGTDVAVLEFQGEWVEEEGAEEFIEALRNRQVEEVMREEFVTIAPDAAFGEALRALVEEDHRRLLVVDEDEKIIGIVTRTDLLRLLTGGV